MKKIVNILLLATASISYGMNKKPGFTDVPAQKQSTNSNQSNDFYISLLLAKNENNLVQGACDLLAIFLDTVHWSRDTRANLWKSHGKIFTQRVRMLSGQEQVKLGKIIDKTRRQQLLNRSCEEGRTYLMRLFFQNQ
jgi:hypothetical protein